ncbi:rod-binding protein [Roseovarius sp. SCSIO 43702]|nr:rod-binding protein [Roseovarius sp. SCSIO 43702]
MTPPAPRPQGKAGEAARKLEAAFLSEMLKSAGLGEQENSFSGGPGEAQFASFQRDLLADAMVEKGGIGLAQLFFNAMTEHTHDR